MLTIERRIFFIFCLLGFLLSPTLIKGEASEEDSRQKLLQKEEEQDYFKKWVNKDVVYIITPEERSVFESLTTPEEKEQFIEQFWYRRDSDLTIRVNEFKEEHYRRIAYANEHFTSGVPGWTTDRGRVYIIHGPPVEIRSNPSGGHYQRRVYEGGGTTSTYPFVVWRYRYIEGIGPDVELEFVDPSWTGEYHLAIDPSEKDAFADIPGKGLTFAERLGFASKADRRFRREKYLTIEREKDNPFTRYETYVNVQRPQEIKYQDLKEIVDINVTYSNLPYEIRNDCFRLNQSQVVVPVTLELENKELTFKEELGIHRAQIALYGIVTSITNRVVAQFEDDVDVLFQSKELERGRLGRSLYQKMLLLDQKTRYKLDLVVKDLNSGKVGVKRQAIIPTRYTDEKLTASSLILSDFIRPVEEVPKEEQMFVLGDIRIHPSLSNKFSVDKWLGAYLQVYNASLDQTTLTPSLRINYRILRDGQVVLEHVDERNETVQFYSGQRVVLITRLPIQKLDPGKYHIQIEVQDRLKDQFVKVEDSFDLLPPTRTPAKP
ncbi:GWxTD domain-containing protein [Acidobacteria bacterium AH-259-G07]|nr:GWxTD domain-containing protein [Acidobacteria bacterium AH-259-G07]